MTRRESALLALSIGLLAGGALGYQVLLFRLLAIIQWHPFAAMIISLALLGHGAAGTALALGGHRLLTRFPAAYATSAVLFAVSIPICWAGAQRLPFNGLELVWSPGELGWLAGLFMLLALPFFFAACCFGLAFMHARERIPVLYAADLLGAGLGAALATALLFLLAPDDGLRAVALCGVAAAVLLPAPKLVRLALPALAVMSALLIPHSWLAPRITEFKGLPRTLQVMGSTVEAEYSSPYGLLTVVRNETIPFRHAPGRSLAATSEPPPQLAVFTDGDAMTAVTDYDGHRETLAYLDETTSALPYHLIEHPRVLVLGAGGGADVLQALYHDAPEIHAVELNPTMLALLRARLSDARVRLHPGDARGFVRADQRHYELIQLAPLDSYAGSGAGVQAMAESYLYTVEALADYYALLVPGGYLALTRWEKQPPREGLKLFATAVRTLAALGADPSDQLALIRGWQTSTLLIKRGALTPGDVERLRAFCQSRGFDPAWFPGIVPEEVNRYHRVPRPWLYEGAVALLGTGAERFLADYKFHIAPATDDRPYFFHFFRWNLLPELIALRGQGGLTLLDTGYLVLVGTLAFAAPLSLLLILAPLAVLRRQQAYAARVNSGVYFLSLGLAFLFVEIACMQRYGLFVGQPLIAMVAVLAGFLVFAGAGSLVAARIQHRARVLQWVVAGIMFLLLIQAMALPPPPGILASTAGRVGLTLMLIAPLAFLMGMPFPLGLSRLADEAPVFIPWAWGINGCASVLSALLAALLAVHVGYRAVLLTAAGLYALAVLVWPTRAPSVTGGANHLAVSVQTRRDG
ncbi:MAG: spermidine synthase [Steroidobacteraceae bacterium]